MLSQIVTKVETINTWTIFFIFMIPFSVCFELMLTLQPLSQLVMFGVMVQGIIFLCKLMFDNKIQRVLAMLTLLAIVVVRVCYA